MCDSVTLRCHEEFCCRVSILDSRFFLNGFGTCSTAWAVSKCRLSYICADQRDLFLNHNYTQVAGPSAIPDFMMQGKNGRVQMKMAK